MPLALQAWSSEMAKPKISLIPIDQALSTDVNDDIVAIHEWCAKAGVTKIGLGRAP